MQLDFGVEGLGSVKLELVVWSGKVVKIDFSVENNFFLQAAKNLMNAVVLTVKASYVASTKYPRQAASAGLNAKPIVVWKMKVKHRYDQSCRKKRIC
jgi:hypothetical protein